MERGVLRGCMDIDGAQVHMHKYLCPYWAQVNHENGNGLGIFAEFKEPTEPRRKWLPLRTRLVRRPSSWSTSRIVGRKNHLCQARAVSPAYPGGPDTNSAGWVRSFPTVHRPALQALCCELVFRSMYRR